VSQSSSGAHFVQRFFFIYEKRLVNLKKTYKNEKGNKMKNVKTFLHPYAQK